MSPTIRYCEWIQPSGIYRTCLTVAVPNDDLCHQHRAHVDALLRITESWVRKVA